MRNFVPPNPHSIYTQTVAIAIIFQWMQSIFKIFMYRKPTVMYCKLSKLYRTLNNKLVKRGMHKVLKLKVVEVWYHQIIVFFLIFFILLQCYIHFIYVFYVAKP